MLTLLKKSLCVGVVVIVAATSWATGKVNVAPAITKELVATNLLHGLQSKNKGLKESAAFLLGEERVSRGVVPLMQMLRNEEDESSRIIAALSLCRIGDPRGVYAVKGAAKFDDSEKVRTLCAWFYNQYVKPGSFEFVAVQPAAPVEYGRR